MKNILKFDLQTFFDNCKISSNHSYENLKIILNWLEDLKTQSQARIILHKIEEYLIYNKENKTCINNYHFSIDKLTISGKENQENTLTLLQLPSIFLPEDWSFSFFEGLMRCSQEDFCQRTLAELGCGNGWISIALAQRHSPEMIYGLDINPRAIVCAKINLYLNALNSNGELIKNSEGKSILDQVQFHVSDLLGYCLDNKIVLDKVIGCIPQVLAPDIGLMNEIIAENSTDEELFALSNYCSKQGFVEDQFGLGLVARAVEESIQILKTNGKIIFNLGGRPGQAVLNRLFTRRGFFTQTLWQTKIQQAGDTDVLPLVNIEENSNYRFEFFMSPHSTESISARTAYAFLNAGGSIYHSLNVISADLKNTNNMKNILELLKNKEYENARGALDLTYEDDSLVSEKILFLSRLSQKLKSLSFFPYDDVKGNESFRSRIADFFRHYWKAPVTKKNILIAPNRTEIIKNFIQIFNIKKSLIDTNLCKTMPHEMLQVDPRDQNQNVIIEIPRNSHSVCELVQKLKPQLVVCCFSDQEIQNQDSILRLIEVTKKINCKLILDLSEHFNLSIFQKSSSIIEYISQNYLPKHVTLICELIYNNVYEDMTNAFVLSENFNLLRLLANSAELTYSRASFVNQEYYDTILYNLVSFYINTENRAIRLPIQSSDNNKNINEFNSHNISNSAKSAFSDSALESENFELNSNSIRLDYGENELPSPLFLKSILMESFARQNISNTEIKIEEQIAKSIKNKFELNFNTDNIQLGNGIAPLFSSITKYCAKNKIHLLFPTGAYGYFIATAKFWGTSFLRIDTKEENLFKYNMRELEEFFNNHSDKKYFLFLNAPVVNPMGQIYTPDEIENIILLCKKFNHTVILDTIFSGLEFNLENICKINSNYQDNIILLGGISKEYSAAGIRFGYMCTHKKELSDYIRNDNSILLPKTLKYIATKLFSLINAADPLIQHHRNKQINCLKERADILTSTLLENGWEPLKSQGGLFLIAKPVRFIGKKYLDPVSQKQILITYDNIHEVLFKVTGLLINGSQWCGIPMYCRFVLSVNEKDFISGCQKIKEFYLKI